MHFGKHCEARFAATSTGLPSFPYKYLKKQLKLLLLAEDNDPKKKAAFFAEVAKILRRLEHKWSEAARLTLFAVRSPRTASLLYKVKFGIQTDAGESAVKLVQWADLATDALRKLIKKYNKQCAARYGGVAMYHGHEISFVRGRMRTELEALVQLHRRPTSAADDDEHEDLACPVCLETLYLPCAPQCGHALCGPCHAKLVSASKDSVPQCPICRNPAAQSKRLPVLAYVAKACDAAGFKARCEAEAEGAKPSARTCPVDVLASGSGGAVASSTEASVMVQSNVLRCRRALSVLCVTRSGASAMPRVTPSPVNP